MSIPRVLIGLALATPLALSAAISFFTARSTARRAVGTAFGDLQATASRVLEPIQQLESGAAQLTRRVQKAVEESTKALTQAGQARALASEANEVAQAVQQTAEQSGIALTQMVQQAQLSVAQLREILELAREQVVAMQDINGANDEGRPENGRASRPHGKKRQRAAKTTTEPAHNGALLKAGA